jgi:hypothetical protein
MTGPDTAYASACLMLASIRMREGDAAGAREILDDLRQPDAPFGAAFAARIVEESLAQIEPQKDRAA